MINVLVSVQVGLALSRPPKTDRTVFITVSESVSNDLSDLRECEIEALLFCTRMAVLTNKAVMAVSARIIKIEL